jgi:amino acid permease
MRVRSFQLSNYSYTMSTTFNSIHDQLENIIIQIIHKLCNHESPELKFPAKVFEFIPEIVGHHELSGTIQDNDATSFVTVTFNHYGSVKKFGMLATISNKFL